MGQTKAKKKTTKGKAAAKKKGTAQKKAAGKTTTRTKSTGKGSPPKKAAARKTAAGKRTTARSGVATPKPRANELDTYRELLERQRVEILDLYRNDLRVGKDNNEDGTEDIVDRANNAYNRELTFSISDGERQLLLQIDEAVERIDQGTFGRCTHCDRDIGRFRLQAIPWARYCIDCQELEEKGLLGS